jgi:hypothetical protein
VRSLRRTLGLGIPLVLYIVATATGALADLRAQWHMDETSGSTMTDTSGHRNHGQISPTVTLGKPGIASGRAYGFNGIDSYVRVPTDNDSLDPFDQNITVTAWVRLVGPIQDDSYDVVRKGLGSSVGGDWKLEIKNFQRLGAVGKLKCTFRGDVASISKTAKPDIMDGAAHRLQCVKTPTQVIAVVDGRQFKKTATPGTINNSDGAMVGAKTTTDDVFNGDLDEITVEIGP